jgi:hypothetical protein
MNSHDPADYPAYRDLRRRTPLKKYPWGTIGSGIATTGLAGALGYQTAGVLTRAAEQGPLRSTFSRMTPRQNAAFFGTTGALALAAGTTAAGLMRVAGQARVAEEMARRHELELKSLQKQQTGAKVASVREVRHIYAMALAAE